MNKEMLINYLENIVNVQQELIIMNRVINELDNKISKLMIRYNIKEPHYTVLYDNSIYDIIFGPILWAGIIYIPILIIWFIILLFNYEKITSFPFLQGHPIWQIFILSGITSLFLGIIFNHINNNSLLKEDYEKKRVYENSISQQEIRLEKEKKRKRFTSFKT